MRAPRGERAGVPAGPGPLRPLGRTAERHLLLVFPDLACELAIFERESRVGVAGALALDPPLAVVLVDDRGSAGVTIAGVTSAARQAGVLPGQTLSEARRRLPSIEVGTVTQRAMRDALAGFSEMALGAGRDQRRLPDALSVRLTAGALREGDVLDRVCERFRRLGHRVRGAVAASEVTALLVARQAGEGRTVVAPGDEAQTLAAFPATSAEQAESELARHPRGAPECGDELIERHGWLDEVRSADALHFAVHGLCARAGARLAGRGQGATRAWLEVSGYSLQATRPLTGDAAPETRRWEVALAAPLRRGADVAERLVSAVREGASLSMREVRLGLGGLVAMAASGHDDEALRALVSSLEAEIGSGRLGLLASSDASALPRLHDVPSPSLSLWPSEALTPPTRVLDVPAPVTGKLARGARVDIGEQTFVVQRVTPVEPSSGSAPGHDHLIVWLSHGDSGALGWIVRDRRSKRALLRGWFT